MENFRAIYQTEAHDLVKYDFKAEDIDKAIKFCESHFSVPVNKIATTDHLGEKEDIIRILNCYTIEDVYNKYWNDESFKFYYNEKLKAAADQILTSILQKEGISNPFKNLKELRQAAFDYKANKSSQWDAK